MILLLYLSVRDDDTLYPRLFFFAEAISDIVESEYNGVDEHVVYGVFNTPVNSIGGSAICAFSLRAIVDTFNGPFKEQENMNSNWLPVSNYKVNIRVYLRVSELPDTCEPR